jgi:DNA-binding CsgD family transcriptional regulator
LSALELHGLDNGDARALLQSAVRFSLDERVRDRIVAETRGNPLALLELPRGLTATELAVGFGLPETHALTGRIEQGFVRRLQALPEETRRLLLMAAAEPVGDPVLLWRAAERVGVEPRAVEDAELEGLVAVGERVIFRHPLVRSAIYGSATTEDRRAVHVALAEATDRDADPDRWAWHLAAAAAGPDEHVAVELERSAGRAQARGGMAAAAAFLQRAVVLTQDPGRRAERALSAAQKSLQAGAFDEALRLVATAEVEPLDESQRARVALLRGHVAFASGSEDAPSLLLKAATRLEPFDMAVARETYLNAWGAASLTAYLDQGGPLMTISRSIRALPPPLDGRGALDLLLDALGRLAVDGYAAAAPTFRLATTALAHIPVEDVLKWGWASASASMAIWDDEGMCLISARQVDLVREAGQLAQLPIHLSVLAYARASIGDLPGAASLVAEVDNVTAATGSQIAPYALLKLRALQGRETEASAPIANAIEQGFPYGYLAAAALYNGLARYEEAASAARQAAEASFDPWAPRWALPELVEAAARAGDRALACDALDRLTAATHSAGTDWALGLEARCRALVTEGADADGLYRAAIERLGRTVVRPELARAHLLYGEWLRRGNRRADARAQLAVAHELFTSIGMEAFAERARRELVATGGRVRKRTVETTDELTAQEWQVALLARDGMSNSDIGARLFLSQHTIAYHLRKVFSKLGISSRRELAAALPSSESELAPA